MPWPKGKPRSQETKDKIGAFFKGKYKGQDNPYWKGGRSKNEAGYILILARDHPNAMPNGYVLEHRRIMEIFLKRYLTKNEHIHHKNGNRADNRIENLEIVDEITHQRMHHVGAKRSAETRAKISAAMIAQADLMGRQTLICYICGKEFQDSDSRHRYCHNPCSGKGRRGWHHTAEAKAKIGAKAKLRT